MNEDTDSVEATAKLNEAELEQAAGGYSNREIAAIERWKSKGGTFASWVKSRQRESIIRNQSTNDQ